MHPSALFSVEIINQPAGYLCAATVPSSITSPGATVNVNCNMMNTTVSVNVFGLCPGSSVTAWLSKCLDFSNTTRYQITGTTAGATTRFTFPEVLSDGQAWSVQYIAPDRHTCSLNSGDSRGYAGFSATITLQCFAYCLSGTFAAYDEIRVYRGEDLMATQRNSALNAAVSFPVLKNDVINIHALDAVSPTANARGWAAVFDVFHSDMPSRKDTYSTTVASTRWVCFSGTRNPPAESRGYGFNDNTWAKPVADTTAGRTAPTGSAWVWSTSLMTATFASANSFCRLTLGWSVGVSIPASYTGAALTSPLQFELVSDNRVVSTYRAWTSGTFIFVHGLTVSNSYSSSVRIANNAYGLNAVVGNRVDDTTLRLSTYSLTLTAANTITVNVSGLCGSNSYISLAATENYEERVVYGKDDMSDVIYTFVQPIPASRYWTVSFYNTPRHDCRFTTPRQGFASSTPSPINVNIVCSTNCVNGAIASNGNTRITRAEFVGNSESNAQYTFPVSYGEIIAVQATVAPGQSGSWYSSLNLFPSYANIAESLKTTGSPLTTRWRCYQGASAPSDDWSWNRNYDDSNWVNPTAVSAVAGDSAAQSVWGSNTASNTFTGANVFCRLRVGYAVRVTVSPYDSPVPVVLQLKGNGTLLSTISLNSANSGIFDRGLTHATFPYTVETFNQPPRYKCTATSTPAPTFADVYSVVDVQVQCVPLNTISVTVTGLCNFKTKIVVWATNNFAPSISVDGPSDPRGTVVYTFANTVDTGAYWSVSFRQPSSQSCYFTTPSQGTVSGPIMTNIQCSGSCLVGNFTADNEVRIYRNEALVDEFNDWTQLFSSAVPVSYGDIIAVHALNWGGPAFLTGSFQIFSDELAVDAEDFITSNTTDNTRWRCFQGWPGTTWRRPTYNDNAWTAPTLALADYGPVAADPREIVWGNDMGMAISGAYLFCRFQVGFQITARVSPSTFRSLSFSSNLTLALKSNGALKSTLDMTTGGDAVFPVGLMHRNQAFTVEVLSQPAGMVCTVGILPIISLSGDVDGIPNVVPVTCVNDNTITVQVTGLCGSVSPISITATNNTFVNVNGTANVSPVATTFINPVATGTSWSVSFTAPERHSCSFTSASEGTISGPAYVTIRCVTNCLTGQFSADNQIRVYREGQLMIDWIGFTTATNVAFAVGNEIIAIHALNGGGPSAWTANLVLRPGLSSSNVPFLTTNAANSRWRCFQGDDWPGAGWQSKWFDDSTWSSPASTNWNVPQYTSLSPAQWVWGPNTTVTAFAGANHFCRLRTGAEVNVTVTPLGMSLSPLTVQLSRGNQTITSTDIAKTGTVNFPFTSGYTVGVTASLLRLISSTVQPLSLSLTNDGQTVSQLTPSTGGTFSFPSGVVFWDKSYSVTLNQHAPGFNCSVGTAPAFSSSGMVVSVNCLPNTITVVVTGLCGSTITISASDNANAVLSGSATSASTSAISYTFPNPMAAGSSWSVGFTGLDRHSCSYAPGNSSSGVASGPVSVYIQCSSNCLAGLFGADDEVRVFRESDLVGRVTTVASRSFATPVNQGDVISIQAINAVGPAAWASAMTVTTAGRTAAETFITANTATTTSWRCYQGNTAPPAGWQSRNFDDSSWFVPVVGAQAGTYGSLTSSVSAQWVWGPSASLNDFVGTNVFCRFRVGYDVFVNMIALNVASIPLNLRSGGTTVSTLTVTKDGQYKFARGLMVLALAFSVDPQLPNFSCSLDSRNSTTLVYTCSPNVVSVRVWGLCGASSINITASGVGASAGTAVNATIAGTNTATLSKSANVYSFPNYITPGTAWSVNITAQPDRHTCTFLSSNAGVSNGFVNVTIACLANCVIGTFASRTDSTLSREGITITSIQAYPNIPSIIAIFPILHSDVIGVIGRMSSITSNPGWIASMRIVPSYATSSSNLETYITSNDALATRWKCQKTTTLIPSGWDTSTTTNSGYSSPQSSATSGASPVGNPSAKWIWMFNSNAPTSTAAILCRFRVGFGVTAVVNNFEYQSNNGPLMLNLRSSGQLVSNLAITAGGSYPFPRALVQAAMNYTVEVANQPSRATCSVGALPALPLTGNIQVSITCVISANIFYTVQVSGLCGSSSSITVSLNGNTPRAITGASGALSDAFYQFPNPFYKDSNWTMDFSNAPAGHTCIFMSPNSGVASASSTIVISCFSDCVTGMFWGVTSSTLYVSGTSVATGASTGDGASWSTLISSFTVVAISAFNPATNDSPGIGGRVVIRKRSGAPSAALPTGNSTLWRCIMAASEPTGWATDAFNDASWSSALLYKNGFPSGVRTDEGTRWITASGTAQRNLYCRFRLWETVSFTITGLVTPALAGTIRLQIDGNTFDRSVTADGSYTWSSSLSLRGTAFSASINANPDGHTCGFNNVQSGVNTMLSGTVGVTSIAIACTRKTFPITVTVRGLCPGSSMTVALANTVLATQSNVFQPSAAAYNFPNNVPYGSTYNVVVNLLSVPRHACAVLYGNTQGFVSGPSNVTIQCSSACVSGTIRGTSTMEIYSENERYAATTTSGDVSISGKPIAPGDILCFYALATVADEVGVSGVFTVRPSYSTAEFPLAVTNNMWRCQQFDGLPPTSFSSSSVDDSTWLSPSTLEGLTKTNVFPGSAWAWGLSANRANDRGARVYCRYRVGYNRVNVGVTGISGVPSSPLILELAVGDVVLSQLTLSSNCDTMFPLSPIKGSGFNVRVAQQPTGHSCSVTADTQAIGATSDVRVFCGSTLNCIISDWSAWSACRTDDYTEIRTRTIIQQPTNGGAACDALQETRTCTQIWPVGTSIKFSSARYGTGAPSMSAIATTTSTTTFTSTVFTITAPLYSGLDTVSLTATVGGRLMYLRNLNDVIVLQVAPSPLTDDFKKTATFTVSRDRFVPMAYSFESYDRQGSFIRASPTEYVLSLAEESSQFKSEASFTPQTLIGNNQDCQVEDWGAWTMCTQVCGYQAQNRTRNVRNLPLQGGSACPSLVEVRTCPNPVCSDRIIALTTASGKWFRDLTDYGLSLSGWQGFTFQVKTSNARLIIGPTYQNYKLNAYQISIISDQVSTTVRIQRGRDGQILASGTFPSSSMYALSSFWVTWNDRVVRVGAGSVYGRNQLARFDTVGLVTIGAVAVQSNENSDWLMSTVNTYLGNSLIIGAANVDENVSEAPADGGDCSSKAVFAVVIVIAAVLAVTNIVTLVLLVRKRNSPAQTKVLNIMPEGQSSHVPTADALKVVTNSPLQSSKFSPDKEKMPLRDSFTPSRSSKRRFAFTDSSIDIAISPRSPRDIEMPGTPALIIRD